MMYGCRKCNFDLCSACAQATASRSGASSQKPCPSGHSLKSFATQEKGYQCDGCSSKLEKGATMYGCRKCNFDLCSRCANSSVATERPRKRQRTAARSSADASMDGDMDQPLKTASAVPFELAGKDSIPSGSCQDPAAGGVACPTCWQLFKTKKGFDEHVARKACGPGISHCRFCGRGRCLRMSPFPNMVALLRHEVSCPKNPDKQETERELATEEEKWLQTANQCLAPQAAQLAQERKEQRLEEMLKEMDEQLLSMDRQLREESSASRACADEVAFKIADGEDRRAAYIRIVHRIQEPITIPRALTVQLMPHQVEGLEWLMSLYHNRLGGILADEMGLGKTMQTISLIASLAESGCPGPHLIVCPMSVCMHWQKEFQRALPDYAHGLIIYRGNDSEKKQLDQEISIKLNTLEKKVVVVTNFEQVSTRHVLNSGVLYKQNWELLVIDEGHRMKNSQTLFHRTVRSKFAPRMKLLLTGTPLQNNVEELFNLMSYIMPGVFQCGESFKAWFTAPLKDQGDLDLEFSEDEERRVLAALHAMLAPFLLQRSKDDTVGGSLPPKREETVWTELSPWQSEFYEDLKRKTLRVVDEGGHVSSELVNNVTMQLRKIALHPFLFHRTPSASVPAGSAQLLITQASGKLAMLDRILEDSCRRGRRVLVFSQFTSMLDIIQEFLELRAWTWERIDGQVDSAERQLRINRFSRKEGAFVFLLSSRAGGLGLNLQAADTVVLFDLDWNPQNDKQAIARAHRIGQTREVLVIRLLALAPIEEHILETTERKLDMEHKLIGAGAFSCRGQAVSAEEREAQLRRLFMKEPGSIQRKATSPEELHAILGGKAEG
eukprot:TRINITY_DN6729_c0_g2_i3.p1 TRINITY_DN6729_c0_g2~~TRINITY_DN6729_c0_g2_i3.p1  ORF type:complete len:837 (-),score=172.01 TRINITY_DN6729_c0_g2_i3:70-2580(-)